MKHHCPPLLWALEHNKLHIGGKTSNPEMGIISGVRYMPNPRYYGNIITFTLKCYIDIQWLNLLLSNRRSRCRGQELPGTAGN